MKYIEPPKPMDEMTPEELERFQELVENLNHHDAWDTLEELRLALNSSHLEAMHHLKRSSRFGPGCTYYRKAKLLFYRDQAGAILSLLDKINQELQQLSDLGDIQK